ncbi:type Z 30S ribosomal protein S14 [Candidatus Aerophobetes bacterium]|uniref:Small ribosomal subunit protein uS14 n=1 Tax=Aerophobetes bacterium TaxID=2030807 RepID=A0A662CZ57_UNCAE|nr:MAG: type Z 30S ribosomal protein S14 [Candidatus Aerophobetes bacterium]
MARKCLIEKAKRDPKFKVRFRNRCKICGRPRGYMRKFEMCRICFRRLVHQGNVPGVKKASW